MNKQCKFCIHSDVCAYKEHYEDAVKLYEKAKNECGKYPYFVCDIRCVKYCKAEKELRIAESVGYGMSEVKIGQVIVDSYGISKVVKLDDWGGYTTEQIIPKEVFIEAYNKYIKIESEEGKWV